MSRYYVPVIHLALNRVGRATPLITCRVERKWSALSRAVVPSCIPALLEFAVQMVIALFRREPGAARAIVFAENGYIDPSLQDEVIDAAMTGLDGWHAGVAYVLQAAHNGADAGAINDLNGMHVCLLCKALPDRQEAVGSDERSVVCARCKVRYNTDAPARGCAAARAPHVVAGAEEPAHISVSSSSERSDSDDSSARNEEDEEAPAAEAAAEGPSLAACTTGVRWVDEGVSSGEAGDSTGSDAGSSETEAGVSGQRGAAAVIAADEERDGLESDQDAPDTAAKWIAAHPAGPRSGDGALCNCGPGNVHRPEGSSGRHPKGCNVSLMSKCRSGEATGPVRAYVDAAVAALLAGAPFAPPLSSGQHPAGRVGAAARRRLVQPQLFDFDDLEAAWFYEDAGGDMARQVPPLTEDVLAERIPVMTTVTRSAVPHVSLQLRPLLSNLAPRAPTVVWHHFLIFAALVLSVPQLGADKSAVVIRRCRMWRAGRFQDLWVEAKKAPRHLGPRGSGLLQAVVHLDGLCTDTTIDADSLSPESLAKALRLTMCGLYQKATTALAAAKMADATQETADRLQEKHPLPSAEEEALIASLPAPALPTEPIVVKPRAARRALYSFKPGSAAGPSGLSADIIRQCVGQLGTSLLEAWATAMTTVCNGQVPEDVRKFIFGAALIALLKDDNGLRPIAAGEVLRRASAKHLAFTVQKKARAVLLPLGQVGVATAGGLEGAAAFARAEASVAGDGDVQMKMDVKNAFNSLWRSAALLGCLEHFAEIAPYAFAAYRHPTILRFAGRWILSSACGVQQGDPLGPLIFALVFSLAVSRAVQRSIEAGTPIKSRAAYLDDLLASGKAAHVAAFFVILTEELRKVGLELAPEKCQVICADHRLHRRPNGTWGADAELEALFPGCKFFKRSEWDVLGIPCGGQAQSAAFVDAKLATAVRRAERVAMLDSPHAGVTLLRFCCGVPAATFYCRAVGPAAHVAFQKVDVAMRAAFVKLCGAVSDSEWAQLALPPRLGGLCLRSAVAVAPFAVIASAAAAASLFDRFPVPGVDNPVAIPLPLLTSPFCEVAAASPVFALYPLLGTWLTKLRDGGNSRKAQHAATVIVEDAIGAQQLELAAATSPEEHVRVMSCRAPGVMHAMTPSPVNGPVMPFTKADLLAPDEFAAALGLRLGRRVAPPSATKCCFCGIEPVGSTLDEHVRRCGRGGGKQRTHTILKAGMMQVLEAAGMAPRSEVSPFPGRNLRLDIVGSVGTTSVLIDVAVCCPSRAPLRAAAQLKPGGGASSYEVVKTDKYGAHVAAGEAGRGAVLVPFVLDVFGGAGESAVEWTKTFARNIATRWNIDQSVTVPFVRQFAAAAVTLGVARQLAEASRRFSLSALVAAEVAGLERAGLEDEYDENNENDDALSALIARRAAPAPPVVAEVAVDAAGGCRAEGREAAPRAAAAAAPANAAAEGGAAEAAGEQHAVVEEEEWDGGAQRPVDVDVDDADAAAPAECADCPDNNYSPHQQQHQFAHQAAEVAPGDCSVPEPSTPC